MDDRVENDAMMELSAYSLVGLFPREWSTLDNRGRSLFSDNPPPNPIDIPFLEQGETMRRRLLTLMYAIRLDTASCIESYYSTMPSLEERCMKYGFNIMITNEGYRNKEVVRELMAACKQFFLAFRLMATGQQLDQPSNGLSQEQISLCSKHAACLCQELNKLDTDPVVFLRLTDQVVLEDL